MSLDAVMVPMATAPENAMRGSWATRSATRAHFERVLAADSWTPLMGGNESPIKRAVLDAGIGGDATAFLMDSQAMPVALFELKGRQVRARSSALWKSSRGEAARLVADGIPRPAGGVARQLSFELRQTRPRHGRWRSAPR